MTPLVVDTVVVSFLFKNDGRAKLYLPFLKDRQLLVSFRTEAELEQWILIAKWDAGRALRFREFMRSFASVPSSRGWSPTIQMITWVFPTLPALETVVY